MHPDALPCPSTVIPGLHYRDAPKAIEWLCGVLGFERHTVVANQDGTIAHAELTFGNGMIMLGSAAASQQTGLRDHTAIGLLASDPDALFARANKAGAEIEKPIADQPFGGRAFTCRDPEGQQWWVGNYDPWTKK